ncbi:MAG TPA: DUF6049 family protein [Streptosporangiaceae bacterium]|jgi:hypothetical protein
MTARQAARLLTGVATAAVVLTLAAGPAALALPAQDAHGRVSVSIESVSPQWATPDRTVTVRGIVTNGTGAPLPGLSVQLRSSADYLGNRDYLTQYAAGQYQADVPEGVPVTLPGTLAAGASKPFKLTLQPSAVGMTVFGVYPLAAQVLNAAQLPVATDRTFLPFWPGGQDTQEPQKLSIAWVWPLMGLPDQAACPSLVGNRLANSLAVTGRLGALLAAGNADSSAADLTWAIDPALVQDAQTMSKRYTVGGSANCTGAKGMPASRAAKDWLSTLSGVLSSQQSFLTPYANVDVAALSHDGLDADLRNAFSESQTMARSLHLPASATTTAWPPGGLADSGVLGSLAVNGVGTVVLNSAQMPPSGTIPSYTPSAQTTIPSGVGSSLNVLLADSTISQILSSDNSGGSAPGAAFATGQNFLAQTAMIVAEAPALARSLVVAPPQQWNPPAGLASELLSDTVRAPWLAPTSLSALAAVKHPSGQVPRRSPPAHQVSGSELPGSYLAQVKKIDTAVQLQASMFSPPQPGYLGRAVAALESSALRGSTQVAARQDLMKRVLSYLADQARRVTIIDSGRYTLGGSSGRIPVTVANSLDRTVRVRLSTTVPADGRLSILPFDNLVTIAPGKTSTIQLHVHANTVGATQVVVSLVSVDGHPLPGSSVRLSLQATRFGTLALVIMSVALGVFVLTAAARAIRRSRGDGAQNDAETPDQPSAPAATGSVVSGDDLAQHDHPPEDPDEYADARGRASS